MEVVALDLQFAQLLGGDLLSSGIPAAVESRSNDEST
jgi:hypothetical protein